MGKIVIGNMCFPDRLLYLILKERAIADREIARSRSLA